MTGRHFFFAVAFPDERAPGILIRTGANPRIKMTKSRTHRPSLSLTSLLNVVLHTLHVTSTLLKKQI